MLGWPWENVHLIPWRLTLRQTTNHLTGNGKDHSSTGPSSGRCDRKRSGVCLAQASFLAGTLWWLTCWFLGCWLRSRPRVRSRIPSSPWIDVSFWVTWGPASDVAVEVQPSSPVCQRHSLNCIEMNFRVLWSSSGGSWSAWALRSPISCSLSASFPLLTCTFVSFRHGLAPEVHPHEHPLMCSSLFPLRSWSLWIKPTIKLVSQLYFNCQ